jgi:hypothetical protein
VKATCRKQYVTTVAFAEDGVARLQMPVRVWRKVFSLSIDRNAAALSIEIAALAIENCVRLGVPCRPVIWHLRMSNH